MIEEFDEMKRLKWQIEQCETQFYQFQLDVIERQQRLVQQKIDYLKQLQTLMRSPTPPSVNDSEGGRE